MGKIDKLRHLLKPSTYGTGVALGRHLSEAQDRVDERRSRLPYDLFIGTIPGYKVRIKDMNPFYSSTRVLYKMDLYNDPSINTRWEQVPNNPNSNIYEHLTLEASNPSSNYEYIKATSINLVLPLVELEIKRRGKSVELFGIDPWSEKAHPRETYKAPEDAHNLVNTVLSMQNKREFSEIK